jgi:hypothetical protein
MLYADRPSKDELFLIRVSFCDNQKTRMWRRLNVEIHILFHGDISRSVTFRQTKFVTVDDHRYSLPGRFILISFLMLFNMLMVRNVKVMLGENTVCRILQFCVMAYLCKLFNFF